MITKTVSELAELCGAILDGSVPAGGARRVTGPASLGEATSEEVSFLANPRYAPELEATRAAAVLVQKDVETGRQDLVLLRCENPNNAFTRVIEAFRDDGPPPVPGVHPAATVDPSAKIAADASIGPNATVGAKAVVGARTIVHPGAHIGPGASVGADSELHSGAILYAGVRIGARCIIHAGAVLGSDGFGFEPTAEGWNKIPQCGTVVVEDDVEIGANCTIDRARFGETRIGRGAKLDNLVHVAHNVTVGPAALLIAQVGVAGSAKIGARAILAGQAGIIGHITVGAGARVSAQAGVGRDVPPGQDVFGSPARPQKDGLRVQASLGKLPEMARLVRELERRIQALESGR